MKLSAIALGGLLAHYEGVRGYPPPDEKRRIYLRSAELGINLFDMGYGDEVHIPKELKGPSEDRYFSLKVGAPRAQDLEELIDAQLKICTARQSTFSECITQPLQGTRNWQNA